MHSQQQQRLRSALDALDAAFAAEGPSGFQGCLHCYGEEDLAVLSGPARLVPDDLVVAVAMEMPGHWSDFPGLFQRLTPRVIRAAVMGELHVDEGLVATRLLQAGWRDWPAPQAEAVNAVWRAWWRSTLEEYPGPVPVTDVLTLVTVATGALAPWLDIWSATRTPAAERHLEYLIDHWLFEDQVSYLELGFLGEYHATPEMIEWLLGHARTWVGGRHLEDLRLLAQRSADLDPADSALISGGAGSCHPSAFREGRPQALPGPAPAPSQRPPDNQPSHNAKPTGPSPKNHRSRPHAEPPPAG